MPPTAPMSMAVLSVGQYEDAGRTPPTNPQSPGSTKPRPKPPEEMNRRETVFGQRLRLPKPLTRSKLESPSPPLPLKADSSGPVPCSCAFLTGSQVLQKFSDQLL